MFVISPPGFGSFATWSCVNDVLVLVSVFSSSGLVVTSIVSALDEISNEIVIDDVLPTLTIHILNYTLETAL